MTKAKYTVTNVARLVNRKQPKLERKISRILSVAGKSIAQKIKTLYTKKMGKADLSSEDQAIIDAILSELELSEVSIDIIDSISPELIRAYKAAGILGVEQVGINADEKMIAHLDRAALDYAENRAGELIKDLTETSESDLKDIISRAIEDGISSDELSSNIEDMGIFSESRSTMIARTELAFAHVQGNVKGWRETGMVEGKQSILGDLHSIEDECDDCVAAGIVPLDEDFIPGYDFPPYHPNCICDVLPVLMKETNEQDESDQQDEDNQGESE